MSSKFPEDVWEMSSKFQGNVQEMSGNFPGNVQDTSVKFRTKLWIVVLLLLELLLRVHAFLLARLSCYLRALVHQVYFFRFTEIRVHQISGGGEVQPALHLHICGCLNLCSKCTCRAEAQI